MSKLTEQPDKVVPKRVLVGGVVVSVFIVVISLVLPVYLGWSLLFFWLGIVANLIAFALIVKGADRMVENQRENQKTRFLPNLMMRYCLYIIVLVSAWFIGGQIPAAFAFIGVQMAQIVIKLDGFVG